MAGDPSIQHLTKAIKDATHAMGKLAKVCEALNKNLVEIERQRRAEMGIDDIDTLKPEQDQKEAFETYKGPVTLGWIDSCFRYDCDPNGLHHPKCDKRSIATGNQENE